MISIQAQLVEVDDHNGKRRAIAIALTLDDELVIIDSEDHHLRWVSPARVTFISLASPADYDL